MSLFTEENKKAVDAWLNDPTFRGVVESDLGKPVKVSVLWDEGVIRFQSPTKGKELKIKDILDAISVTVH